MLVFAVVLGIVLGGWRYVGKGVPVWSPDWWHNANQTIQSWFDWTSRQAPHVLKQIPSMHVQLPSSINLPSIQASSTR